MHRIDRLRQDGLMGRTAATSDGAATPMEEPAGDAAIVGQGDNLFLRLEEIPACREDAAVLAGIRIAEHHLLLIPGRLQQRLIGRIVEKPAHDLLDPTQILDGLEQGRDLDRAEPTLVVLADQSGQTRQ